MENEVEIALLEPAPGATAAWERELLPRLHAAEQTRYRGFTHVRRRESWLAGRALLLALLERRLERVEPEALRTRSAGGVGYEAASLHINLSHSDGLLAAALASSPVGVDVERLCERPAVRQASRVFTPAEGAHLDVLPEAARLQGFYALWTLKEAAAKAAELSLWEGLHHARFDTVRGAATLDGPFPAGAWSFMHGDVEPDAHLAVALRGAIPTGIRCLRYLDARWQPEALREQAFLRGMPSL